MKKILIILALLTLTACTQDTTSVADDVVVGDDGSDNKLRGIFQTATELAYDRVELELDPALTLASISSIAADQSGHFYIIHRAEDVDSIVVADNAGSVLRTFGQGLFTRAHTIRLDKTGNVWTVDSTSSMVYKFSPEGELLDRKSTRLNSSH